MTLGVADVQNIVRSEIGGMPQLPATTTMVEGRIVTPQINSVCSAGDSIDAIKDQINSALADIKNGLDTLVLNPLKDLATQVLSAINAAIARIQLILATISAAVQTVVNAVLAEIALGIAQIQAIVAYVDSQLKEGLNQILAACSFCSPTQKVPEAKK